MGLEANCAEELRVQASGFGFRAHGGLGVRRGF